MIIERARHELLTDIHETLVPTSCDVQGVSMSIYYPGAAELKKLERIARTCYKSEGGDISIETTAKFIRGLIQRGHEAMLEHESISVKFICDRAVSHELVRHRMASFAQESQRFCNYSKERFGGHITFIQPYWMDEDDDICFDTWKEACLDAEKAYFDMLNQGYSPQQARIVLPNCTKTEIVVTANYREWRHILKLRTAPDALPDMRHLMEGLLEELKKKLPVIFEDI